MRQPRPLLLILLLGFLPSFGTMVLAVDALAIGGICGGATPCECGDRVVASRTLVPGVDPITVTICAERGLEIFFDDGMPPLTLDLGSTTIRGSGQSVGIEINRSIDVTVRNGRVASFAFGILGVAATSSLVSNVQVVENAEAGISFDLLGRENIIEKCIARNNLGDGIMVAGTEDVVRLCRAESNGRHGLVASGTDCTIFRNIVLHSGSDGVEVSGSGARVELNQSNYSDTGQGYLVTGVNHEFVRNVARSNPAGNGFLVGATESEFDRNLSNDNGEFGIKDTTLGGGTGGTANTYTRNVCSGNGLGASDPAGLCS